MKVTEFHAVSWGKERGERARETLWFFDALQDVVLSLCLLTNSMYIPSKMFY